MQKTRWGIEQATEPAGNRRGFKEHQAKSKVATPQKCDLFDFRRPDRISKSQVRAIQLLHEEFARNLAMSLGAYLRSFVSVNVCSVEQLKYGEFLEGVGLPTCVVSLSLRPYDGNALVEVTPALIFPVLDLILGVRERMAEYANARSR